MKIMALFISLFAVSEAFGSLHLIIENPDHLQINASELRSRFDKAYELFKKEIGPIAAPIKVVISGPNCLRTGYNFNSHQVNFCRNGRLIDMGLRSVDVFHHEIFHALICNYNNELCRGEMKEDVHEGLADYFSYLLNPDEHFGENYYRDYAYIREYKTTWKLGLVEKPHERGNVFVSQLIETKSSLRDALKLFEMDSSQSDIENIITGVNPSYLHRYRLTSSDEMKIEFIFSTPVERVEWEIEEGIVIERITSHSFKITIPNPISPSKGLANFIGSDGSILGRRTYYFGSK